MDLLPCRDRRLIRAMEYVTRDLSRACSLALVARVAGLERTYFSKCFFQKTGQRFAAWNAHIRIEHAMQLLRADESAITNIAIAVGYTDVTTFERNFKRSVGLTPRQYRLRQRQIGNARNTINAENIPTNAETHEAASR